MWPSVSRFGPLCRRNPSLTNPEMVKTTSLGVKTKCGSGCKSWTLLVIHYILRSKNLNPNPRCLNPSPYSTNKNPRLGCFWYFPSSASFPFVCFCHLKVFRQVSLLWTPPDLGRVSPQIKPRNEPLPSGGCLLKELSPYTGFRIRKIFTGSISGSYSGNVKYTYLL